MAAFERTRLPARSSASTRPSRWPRPAIARRPGARRRCVGAPARRRGDRRRGRPPPPRADRGRPAAGARHPGVPRRLARDGRGDDAAGQPADHPRGRGGDRVGCLAGDAPARPSSAAFALVWTAFGLVGVPRRRRPPPRRRRDAVAGGAAVAHRGRRSWRSRAATSSSRSSDAASLRAATRRPAVVGAGHRATRAPPRAAPRARLPRQLLGADAAHVRRGVRQPRLDGRPDRS